MSKQFIVLESQGARAIVDPNSGVFSFFDKSAGVKWESDPWLFTAGTLSLSHASRGRVDFLLSAAQNIEVRSENDRVAEIVFARLLPDEGNRLVEARVSVRLSLVGDRDLRVEVLGVDYPIDWSFVELEYPCRLGWLKTDVDNGYLVVPFWQGSIVPSTTGAFQTIPRVPFWAWDDMPWRQEGETDLEVYGWHGVSMPFFGAVKSKSAWAAILETENDASVRCILNSNEQHLFDRRGSLSPHSRLAACSPVWRATRGQFGYPRSMVYSLLPHGDYGVVAKRYRRHAKESGLFVSLDEKIQANPNLERILGGPLVNINGGYPWYIDYPAFRFTWNEAAKLALDLGDTLGVRQGLLCLWIGYQNYPPDSYPFHPINGSVAELSNMVSRAHERGILPCFYHGYPAMLEHADNCEFAKARKINPAGEVKSRWGRRCSAFFVEDARRNLPQSIRDSGQIADYSDMVTAGPLDECWDSAHPLTREQDRRNKEDVFKYINSLGLFTGSENPRGWATPFMAYAKNAGMGGRQPILNCIPVPLFNMVFKDSLIIFREHQPAPDASIFDDLAFGNHIQLHFTYPGYWNTRKRYLDCVRLFQDFNRATAREELLEHRFIDEPNGPYITRFAGGASARVNRTETEREVEGRRLPPDSALLEFGDGRERRATAEAHRLAFHSD